MTTEQLQQKLKIYEDGLAQLEQESEAIFVRIQLQRGAILAVRELITEQGAPPPQTPAPGDTAGIPQLCAT